MDGFMVVNDAVEKEDLSVHMACIFADSASGKKLKKWGLKNTRKGGLQSNVK
jgi:hypothetical protein